LLTFLKSFLSLRVLFSGSTISGLELKGLMFGYGVKISWVLDGQISVYGMAWHGREGGSAEFSSGPNFPLPETTPIPAYFTSFFLSVGMECECYMSSENGCQSTLQKPCNHFWLPRGN